MRLVPERVPGALQAAAGEERQRLQALVRAVVAAQPAEPEEVAAARLRFPLPEQGVAALSKDRVS